jgi:hypothetical protein
MLEGRRKKLRGRRRRPERRRRRRPERRRWWWAEGLMRGKTPRMFGHGGSSHTMVVQDISLLLLAFVE